MRLYPAGMSHSKDKNRHLSREDARSESCGLHDSRSPVRGGGCVTLSQLAVNMGKMAREWLLLFQERVWASGGRFLPNAFLSFLHTVFLNNWRNTRALNSWENVLQEAQKTQQYSTALM